MGQSYYESRRSPSRHHQRDADQEVYPRVCGGTLCVTLCHLFRREGIGVDTSQILTREEIYDRNAAR